MAALAESALHKVFNDGAANFALRFRRADDGYGIRRENGVEGTAAAPAQKIVREDHARVWRL